MAAIRSTGPAHVIEDEGVARTQRPTINFTGAGVVATDAGGKTVVTIPGGAAPAATQKEWYVDVAAAAGGNGRSAAGAFTTFAAAISAAASRDKIYVLSDLNEDCNITKPDLHIVGVGRRVIYGSGSSSVGARTVNIGYGAHYTVLENFYIIGHANFKGVHLAGNVAQYIRVVNVRIDGTLGAAATFYPYANPGTSYTPASGTGIGGVGLMIHQCENSHFEQFEIGNCAIALGLGSWSTQDTFIKFKYDGNCQHIVQGLYTGPNGAEARLTAFGLGFAGNPNDRYSGNCIFMHSQMVSSRSSTLTSPPVIDLFGDGTTNYNGDVGGGNTFININSSESSAEGNPDRVVRIGNRGNKFINFTSPAGTQVKVEGRKNDFDGVDNAAQAWQVTSHYNTFHDFHGVNGIKLDGSYNTIDGAVFDGGAICAGAGNLNTYRLVEQNGTFNLTGGLNKFENCLWLNAAITYASLGLSPSLPPPAAVQAATYSASITVYSDAFSVISIPVTNGTAFTITNPQEAAHIAPTTIMHPGPITFDILNSSGGAMGVITWGAKYALAGAFTNPANGKSRSITFYYNPVRDRWVELSRATADI